MRINRPLFITIYIFFTHTIAYTNEVITSSGTVAGKIACYNGIHVKVYLGIPYAEPPLGYLRFKKPIPVKPWNKAIQAKTLPPGCVQYSTNPFPWLDNLPGLSEDCLYLNIWTPMDASIQNKKSVMFWIHGGGFRIGSSRLDYYNGEALAAEGDVVVVTINYRLGAEGFFYSGTEDAPGNMGIWDMVEALNWVRKNIEAFGGDKDSITLFGQSVGGMSIGMFCVSPITRGMFKRVILQSGAPTNLEGEDNYKTFKTSARLARIVGCAADENDLKQNPGTVVKCMRSKNATMLAITLSDITVGEGELFVYYPRFDNKLLPENPRQAVIDGDFDGVDVLIGTNNGDGSFLFTKTNPDVFGYFGEKNPQINLTFGATIIRELLKSYSDPDAVVEQYLGDVPETDYNKIRFKVLTAAGDYYFACPSVYFAESFARKDGNVYFYFHTHRPSNSPWAPWMLSMHFDETPFVFGYPLRYPENYTKEEQGFSRRLIRMWSCFAKTGIPTVEPWPEYSRENPIYEELNVFTFKAAIGPHKKNCDFFRTSFGF